MKITEKEGLVLNKLNESVTVGSTYEELVGAGVELKPKAYVGVICSLKKKGLVWVEGVGVKASVHRI